MLDLGLLSEQTPDVRRHGDSVLICGDASAGLDLLADETVQTVVTSPPYWSLRDYEVGEQLGRDDTLDTYLARLVRTFDKMKRVLRNDGTVWLNVGDVYTSGSRRYRAPDRKNRVRAMSVRPPGVGQGSTHQVPRDCLLVLEEPVVLLQRRCRSRSQWSSLANSMGHSHVASSVLQGCRSSGRHAHEPCPSVHRDNKPRTWRRLGSLCRLRNDIGGSATARPPMDWNRAQARIH